MEGGPVGVMLHEHSLARSCTADLAEALPKAKSDDKLAIQSVIGAARYYTDFLSNHICKENNILYPMGNQAFSDDDQDYLRQEFDKVQASMGKDFHERYHKMVDDLEQFLESKK